MPDIRLENVTTYIDKNEKCGIFDINLQIKQGDFLFVVGENGAGKSTLLKTITGELTPQSGNVFINELHTLHFKEQKSNKLKIGVMAQGTYLLSGECVYEAMQRIAVIANGKIKNTNRIDKALNLVGLNDVKNRKIKELSAGEKRKVELARALMANPHVLILDEPTAGLDNDATWDLLNLLMEINRKGASIIMATHAKQFVNVLRKRVLRLKHGTIIADDLYGKYGN